MRRIVGWLCFLSLVMAIFGMCYWGYATAAPFFHGAAIHQYAVPDRVDVIGAIASKGLGPSASNVLKSYVTRSMAPSRAYSGWKALDPEQRLMNTSPLMLAIAGDRISADWRMPVTLAAAVYDIHGNLVAVYPEKLKEGLPRMPDVEVRNILGSETRYRVNALRHGGAPRMNGVILSSGWLSSNWLASLNAAGLSRRGNVDVFLSLALRDNTPAGFFVTAEIAYCDRWLVFMPDSAKVQGPLSRWNALWLGAISFLVYLVTLPIWVAMDAGWRGMRPFAWAALIVLTNLIGLAAYLIARLAPPRPCPNCGEKVLVKYRRCPACGVSLLDRCPICNRKMKAGWQVCPVCSGEQPQPAGPVATYAQPPTQAIPIGPISPMCPTAPTAASGLSVSVSDAESGAPLANARVAIAGPATVDALTNRNGTFEARKLCAGHYSITATLEGYEPAHAEADVEEGSSQVASIRLAAGPAGIGGKVLDRQTMNPVCGAQVYLDSSRIDRSATTSGDGAFELEGIPPGPYTIGVEAEGFVGQTRLVETAPGRRASADFTLEKEPRADQ